MDAKLLPCPFCGGKPRIVHTTDADDMKWSHVECGCGVRTRGKWASTSSDKCPIFYQEVRGEWNTRAAQPGAGDYVLVPREPSGEQKSALRQWVLSGYDSRAWGDMLAAAPGPGEKA